MNSTTHFFDILLGIVVLQLDQRPLLHDLGASLCPDLYQFFFWSRVDFASKEFS